jgi:hypothetical protein
MLQHIVHKFFEWILVPFQEVTAVFDMIFSRPFFNWNVKFLQINGEGEGRWKIFTGGKD